ncbi:porin [Luteimonas yindakuii]|uniref:OprO/OprP family phosphate-selective porin n=1 Tax=Luteimonas yindakuii TaxID=2565782 RepID=UPI0010A51403|nr:porin [Luteimonas yindakuii]QCO68009.1 porin [Luteimonas yindakuii]
MRSSLLAVSIAMALGAALPAAAQDTRDRELAELRAQLSQLQTRMAELEDRSDAQSEINIASQQAAEAAAKTQPKVEPRNGGLRVTSADGKSEFSLGGRIHFDAYAFDRDNADVTGTTDFRRARLTLAGKAAGWEYKVEQDFTGGSTTEGFRDVFIARDALGGKVTIGHFKPYRSMEEMTSSNEILMMERPFASATGIYAGRQFQQGVGYLTSGDNYSFGASVFNMRSASGPRNEGMGASTRATWAPINNDDSTLHFGASYSHENLNKGSADVSASAVYAGRRGPSQTIARTTGASGESIDTVGLEAAGAFGPLFFQSEYARATYGQPLGGDQDVDTWYLMGAWTITGERRPYRVGTGVFNSPRPNGPYGAWQLTARYDTIENKDIAGMEASSATFGVNWFINPSVRLMFNYTRGDNEFLGDKTNQFALRTQLSF